MPESVPAPNSSIFSSGKLLLTWFQLLTFDPGSQIFFSSAVVRQSAQSFSGFTTTARPSLATWASPYVDALLLAGRDFLGLDRPRGVGDVGLAGAELLEAAAGAGDPDRDLHVGVLLPEQLGRRLA